MAAWMPTAMPTRMPTAYPASASSRVRGARSMSALNTLLEAEREAEIAVQQVGEVMIQAQPERVGQVIARLDCGAERRRHRQLADDGLHRIAGDELQHAEDHDDHAEQQRHRIGEPDRRVAEHVFSDPPSSAQAEKVLGVLVQPLVEHGGFQRQLLVFLDQRLHGQAERLP